MSTTEAWDPDGFGPTEADSSAELLSDVERFVAEYVVFPSADHLVAASLWIVHTHLADCFESTPRLALLSPEPGSGKTRFLEVAELLTPAPMHVLSASAAAIFRSIEKGRPTLLFDEVDAIFGRRGNDDSNEDLRALLNAGHRAGASIPRCVGPTHDVRQFPVYTPVALAGLGDLPETLMSRCVVIRMRRRAPGEHVTSFRHRVAAPVGHRLRDQLAAWAATVADAVTAAWPDMPPGVTDRPADVWEPLLATADAAGGEWPTRAREACVKLAAANVGRDASLGIRLLLDLKTVFGDADQLATETILNRLHAIEEAPWGDLRGKPLDARGLARRLRQYEITSEAVWIDERTLRGYRAADLYDAWQRYVPPVDPQDVQGAQETATEPGLLADLADLARPPGGRSGNGHHPACAVCGYRHEGPEEMCPACAYAEETP